MPPSGPYTAEEILGIPETKGEPLRTEFIDTRKKKTSVNSTPTGPYTAEEIMGGQLPDAQEDVPTTSMTTGLMKLIGLPSVAKGINTAKEKLHLPQLEKLVMSGRPSALMDQAGSLGLIPPSTGPHVPTGQEQASVYPRFGNMGYQWDAPADPLEKRSMLGSILKTTGETLADFPSTFVGGGIGAADDLLTLGVAGKAAQKVGAYPAIAKGVSAVDDWLGRTTRGGFTLTKRGGMLPENKGILEGIDRKNVVAGNEAEALAQTERELGNFTAGEGGRAVVQTDKALGRPSTLDEQRLIARLMEQPTEREALIASGNAVPINYRELGQPVPSHIPDRILIEMRKAGVEDIADVRSVLKAPIISAAEDATALEGLAQLPEEMKDFIVATNPGPLMKAKVPQDILDTLARMGLDYKTARALLLRDTNPDIFPPETLGQYFDVENLNKAPGLVEEILSQPWNSAANKVNAAARKAGILGAEEQFPGLRGPTVAKLKELGFSNIEEARNAIAKSAATAARREMYLRVQKMPMDVLNEVRTGQMRDLAHTFPEVDLPPLTYAKVAEKLSAQAGMDIKAWADSIGKKPDEVSRMAADMNWFPDIHTNSRVGTFPMPFSSSSMKVRRGWAKMRKERTDELARALGIRISPFEAIPFKHVEIMRAANTQNALAEMAQVPDTVYVGPLAAELEAGRSMEIPGKGFYTRMSSDKSLGALAGQLVRAPEAAEITGMVKRSGFMKTFMDEVYRTIKFGKTVGNPKTNINNAPANAMMMDLGGVDPSDIHGISSGTKSYIYRTSPMWDAAKKNGAPWTAGRGSRLEEIQDAQRSLRLMERGASWYESFLLSVPRKMRSWAGASAMKDSYIANDGIFKQIVFEKAVRNGMDPAKAVAFADRQIVNTMDVPQWMQVVRSNPLGPAFVSYSYKASAPLLQGIMERPLVLYKYKLALDAWNNSVLDRLGYDPQEKMDEFTKALGHPFYFIDPYIDAQGMLHVRDGLGRLTPLSAAIPPSGSVMGLGPLGYIKSVVGNLIAGSAMIPAELISQATGTDFRTGRKFIYGPDDMQRAAMSAEDVLPMADEEMARLQANPTMYNLKQRGKHVLQTISPSFLNTLLPGGEVYGAATGRTNLYGEKRSLPEALSNMVLPRSTSEQEISRRNKRAASGGARSTADFLRQVLMEREQQ